MRKRKQKIIIFDEEKTSAEFRDRLNVYDDLDCMTNEQIIKDTIRLLDDKYGIEKSYLWNNPKHASTAICHDDDAYDEETGMDVACTKADLKYHTSMVSRYKRYVKKLVFIILKLEKLQKFHEKKIDKITNYIARI